MGKYFKIDQCKLLDQDFTTFVNSAELEWPSTPNQLLANDTQQLPAVRVPLAEGGNEEDCKPITNRMAESSADDKLG